MKTVFALCLIFWIAIAGLTGCGGKVINALVNTCNWMDTYIPVADNAVKKIQQDYDKYVAIITGAVPSTAGVLAAAKAWIAGADVALNVLGAVQKGICQELAQIQMALQVTNETLPKTALPYSTLNR